MANYAEPFKAFRFLVEVEDSGAVVAAFSSFSGVKIEVQTVKGRTGDDSRGVKSGVIVGTSFAPVTLTRGVVGDNDFLDWLFAAAAGTHSGPSGTRLKRTLNVVALDERGGRGVTWSLKGAMPIGYELAPMDGSRSDVLSESLTFSISGMERKTVPPE